MGAMGRMKKKLGVKGYKVEPLRNIPFPPLRKMSEVLLEFAEPVLNGIDEDDDRTYRGVLSFAAACWNLSFFPSERRRDEWDRLAATLSKGPMDVVLDMEEWVWWLVERRRTLFADEKRTVVDLRVSNEDDDRHVVVVWTLMEDPVKDLRSK
jgi:hypothetical protein